MLYSFFRIVNANLQSAFSSSGSFAKKIKNKKNADTMLKCQGKGTLRMRVQLLPLSAGKKMED